MRRDEDGDASGHAGLSCDEAVSFEAEDHLVDGRWSDAEMPLHVGFGGRLAEHVRIDVNEGQVVALLFSERLGAGAAHGA